MQEHFRSSALVRMATLVVVVLKKCGSADLCDDFKVKINLYLNVEQYPMSKIEAIYVSLAEIFSLLDVKDAYLQTMVNDASKKGLFPYKILVFGEAFTSILWQGAIDEFKILVQQVKELQRISMYVTSNGDN